MPRQVRVVPDIVATERHSHVQSRDICVSAPTGSGKTLVFVLGVLQVINTYWCVSNRQNHRLQTRTATCFFSFALLFSVFFSLGAFPLFYVAGRTTSVSNTYVR